MTGLNLLRLAYLRLVPELEPFFVTGHRPDGHGRALGHGSPQRVVHLAKSLTTTPGVVAALNSVLVGTLASDVGALLGAGRGEAVSAGVGLSLASAVLHVRYAARFRRRHPPPVPGPDLDAGSERAGRSGMKAPGTRSRSRPRGGAAQDSLRSEERGIS